jgi:hypothetical protein
MLQNSQHSLYSPPKISENREVYETKWKNFVDLDSPQKAVWRMSIACWVTKVTVAYSEYRCAPVSTDSLSAVYRVPKKKFENWRNKRFISFKTPAKQERAVTWWNPAAQPRPVLDASSFAPVPTLPRRTYLHSASSVLAVHISCRVIAVFVFRKPLFINYLYRIYVCYTNITLYIAFGIIRGFT